MKLIPKLQNGNTFQRDNTRVSTPPKPLLKKKEVREIPQRATISSNHNKVNTLISKLG